MAMKNLGFSYNSALSILANSEESARTESAKYAPVAQLDRVLG